MPYFLQKGIKQHTCQEANLSRLVTNIGWVVESANGRIKQWNALEQVVQNSQIPWIGANVQIFCDLYNAYRSPLVSNSNDDKSLAIKML